MNNLKAIWNALRLGLADALLITFFVLSGCVLLTYLILGEPPGGWFTTLEEAKHSIAIVGQIVVLVWAVCFFAEWGRRE